MSRFAVHGRKAGGDFERNHGEARARDAQRLADLRRPCGPPWI